MSYESVEVLKEAILSQAQRDRDRLISDAKLQAQRIVAQAEEDARVQQAQLIGEAESQVVQLRRETKGAARLEAQAIKVRKRESLLNEVFERVAERLARYDEQETYGEVVVGLVEDAMRHMTDAECIVVMADEKAREILKEATVQQVEERLGCVIAWGDPLPQEEGEPHRLGVVVQSGDGRLRYNNTLQARLARMRGGLRTFTYSILMGAAE